ncbi:6-phosphogluconolactonase [Candidatus Woesebacteria bacterium]|nr:6-phosphogluconolactonase [Candidatus Woesebacteria bacterium]
MHQTENISVTRGDTNTVKLAMQNGLAAELSDLAKSKEPVLLLLSGGSALAVLQETELPGLNPLVTFGVLDERFSIDPASNNFQQLKQTRFYSSALAHGCSSIDTSVLEGESQESLRDRFEKLLMAWRRANPIGKIIITQGIGVDGHTSGVLPQPDNSSVFKGLFLEPELWVASYRSESQNPYPLRVTTTLSFLQQVDNSFLYVSGEEKRAALAATLAKKGSLSETPARIIQIMSKVNIFTDLV